jgi:ABC-type transport system involved in multi-copper enzyme maturation permease subunit
VSALLWESVQGLSVGNPLLLPERLQDAAAAGTLGREMRRLLLQYASFHGLLAVVVVGWAVLRLRAAREEREATQRLGARRPSRTRPAVSRNPVLWKEIYVEAAGPPSWAVRVVTGLVVLASFAPAVLIVIQSVIEPAPAVDPLQERLYRWVLAAGTVAASLGLLAVALRAAGSVTGERERHTLDSLLVTRLGPNEIVRAKWLGSILGTRIAWLWPGTIWALGLLTGALHPLGAVFLIVGWLGYAGSFAAWGVWYSASKQSTQRATVATLLGLLGLSACLLWPPPLVLLVFAAQGTPTSFLVTPGDPSATFGLGMAGLTFLGLWVLFGLAALGRAADHFAKTTLPAARDGIDRGRGVL